MRRVQYWLIGVAALVLSFGVSFFAASSFTLNSPPGLHQDPLTQTVTNSVRDQFTVNQGVPLTGQQTDLDGGNGYVNNSGPTWTGYTGGVASNDWQNAQQDYVTRSTGGTTQAIATIEWLTRRTTITYRLTNVTASLTNTNGGYILGADATGTKGLVLQLYWNGSTYMMRFFLVTSATGGTSCSSDVNTGATAGNTYAFTFTYSPATGAAATGSLSKSGGGGGTYNVTSTCNVSTANGTYAGLFSGTASVMRYDTIVASL